MKFTIIWNEIIYRTGNLDAAFTEEDIKYINTFPNAKIREKQETKDTIKFDCSDTFEAKNIEEAKEIVTNKYLEQYNGAEFFDCKDEQGRTVFTEIDL